MAKAYLKYGITEADRNNRKTEVVKTTWENLPEYFENQLKNKLQKLVRDTVYAEKNIDGFPMEARMMFLNSVVPLGTHPEKGTPVRSVPCSSEEQGKKQLVEFIEDLRSDEDTQRFVANFFHKNIKRNFDKSSIPSELLTH
mgnify:CR=1 FL=1